MRNGARKLLERVGARVQPDALVKSLSIAEQGGPQAVANVAAGLTPDGHTILEPGEDGQTLERRANFADAPPDRLQPGDPYREADAIHERVIREGAQERVALGAWLNSVVNAAAHGDQRAIVKDRRQQFHGGLNSGGE